MQEKIRGEQEINSFNQSDSLSLPSRSQEIRLNKQNYEFNKEETPETTARLVSFIQLQTNKHGSPVRSYNNSVMMRKPSPSSPSPVQEAVVLDGSQHEQEGYMSFHPPNLSSSQKNDLENLQSPNDEFYTTMQRRLKHFVQPTLNPIFTDVRFLAEFYQTSQLSSIGYLEC